MSPITAVDPGTEFEPTSAQVIPLDNAGFERCSQLIDDNNAMIAKLMTERDTAISHLRNVIEALGYITFDGAPIRDAKKFLQELRG